MTPHLLRASLLMAQQRWELAEAELRLALADDGQNADAHRLLALCLSEREQFDAAEAEARMAVQLAPDDAQPHLALAQVLAERNRLDEARSAVEEAIRLDAFNADALEFLGMIRFQKRDWQGALDAADQGLAIDPDNNGCTNLRAMALVKLGRRKEAGQTIQTALARDPEDALTHANQGWALLEAGSREQAMQHFREALRLDPTADWARAGIVEGLKSKNFVYRWLLRYFLFMSRLRGRTQWLIIVGLFVVMRGVSSLSRNNPAAAPFLQPLVVVYGIFVVLTWLGSPLFNLLLFLDKSGRYALSADDRKSTLTVAGVLAAAAVMFVAYLAMDDGFFLAVAINTAVVAIPASAIFGVCSVGWPRWSMLALTLALAALGLFPLYYRFMPIVPGTEQAIISRIVSIEGVFVFAVIGSQFAAQALARVTPRR